MDAPHPFRELPEYAAKIIHSKAKKLVGCYGFTASDREDIGQELAMFLWSRLRHFDARKGKLKPFIDHQIKKGIATLIEHRLSGKRDYRREGASLCGPIRDGDGDEVQRINLVDETEGARRLGIVRQRPCRRADMAMDVNALLGRLRPELRDLGEQLLGMTITEISRETGTPRGTLYERRRELRRVFEDARLTEYLEKD